MRCSVNCGTYLVASALFASADSGWYAGLNRSASARMRWSGRPGTSSRMMNRGHVITTGQHSSQARSHCQSACISPASKLTPPPAHSTRIKLTPLHTMQHPLPVPAVEHQAHQRPLHGQASHPLILDLCPRLCDYQPRRRKGDGGCMRGGVILCWRSLLGWISCLGNYGDAGG
jgi:hypothetical protein